MPRKDNANTPASAQAQQNAVSEGIENFELPRALVTRIAKSGVPENVKLQKDTVLSLVKGATVFINYLGAAHEVSTSKQHKSISASDVFKALELIEFADLIPSLQAELQGTLINMPSSSSTAVLRRAYPPPNVIFLSPSVYRELAKSKKVRPSGARLPAHPQPGAKAAQAHNAGRERSEWLQRTRSACRLLYPTHLGRCLSSHNRACRWRLLRRLQLLTLKRTLWLRG
ncbi:hypothetical protein BC826DRAFT_912042 [Russula brevipes]|nr:hypothetical protein BC826DRAFT_912042 [Russula brevipes]